MSDQSDQPRMFFLDNLRTFLTILVVLHHAAITYGASGSWFYYATISEGLEDALTSILLTMVTAVNSSFFMGAFFLLSGYFTPGSYDRKGPLMFLKDRLIRLGIPLVLFAVFISPFIFSYRAIMVFNDPRPLIELYLLTIKLQIFSVGPLWFVQALLILAFGYAIWREFNNAILNLRRTPSSYQETEMNNTSHSEMDFPRTTWILQAIFLLGLFTFIVRIFIPSDEFIYNLPIGDSVQYLVLFVLGIVAYRQNWFSKITETQGKFWIKVTLGSIIFLIVFVIVTGAFEGDVSAFQGGFSWQSALGSFWSSIMCVSICISLLYLFRYKINSSDKYARFLSKNAYTVYIIHAPVLVVTSISLTVLVLHPMLKFVVVLIIALFLCFAISQFGLRQIPGSKRVLG